MLLITQSSSDWPSKRSDRDDIQREARRVYLDYDDALNLYQSSKRFREHLPLEKIGMESRVRRLRLILNWPVGTSKSLSDRIEMEKVKKHLQDHSYASFVIKGLWAGTGDDFPIIYCNKFFENHLDFEYDLKLFQDHPDMQKYWPSLTQNENSDFWRNVWVSAFECFN